MCVLLLTLTSNKKTNKELKPFLVSEREAWAFKQRPAGAVRRPALQVRRVQADKEARVQAASGEGLRMCGKQQRLYHRARNQARRVTNIK